MADVSVFASATVNDVVGGRGPTGFVAVGSISQAGHTNGAMWRSPDGRTWTAVALQAPDATFLRVIEGGPGLVAVAEACQAGVEAECGVPDSAWTSVDGSTWSAHQIDDCCRATAVAAGRFGVVAVGEDANATDNDAVASVSADGSKWAHATDGSSFKGASMGAVAAGGPGVVALGNGPSTLLAWTSPDGHAWTVAPPSDALASGEIRDMVPMGSKLIGVGRDGSQALALTSTDGLAWTKAAGSSALAGAAMNRLVVAGTAVVAVGTGANGGAIWQSSDGLTWTLETVPTGAAQYTAVAATPTTVAAFGAATNGTVVILLDTIGST